MNVHKAAELLGVGRHAVYQYHRQGSIRARKDEKGRLDFDEEDVRSLAKIIRSPDPSVFHQILQVLGIKLEDVLNKDRKAVFVDKRQTVSVILHKEGFSFREIADMFGMGHSSIHPLIHKRKENAYLKQAKKLWQEAKKKE